MTTSNEWTLQVQAGVAYLTLQRPPMNGFTPSFCDELAGALAASVADPQVRAIALRSRGPCFSVGADLKWAAGELQAGRGGKALSDLVRAMHRAIFQVYSSPKPVVSLIEGAAAGGGMALALAADVRLASDKALFRLAYPTVAINLDGGTSLRLPQLIGLGRSTSWLYQDRDLSAVEAQQWGLVEHVGPDGPAALDACLQRLVQGPTVAWGKSKFLLNPPEVVQRQLDREAEQIESLGECRDTWHGVESFLRKQSPVFEGR